MIVPEALICGTPVYASLGTPWNELNECHCGWWRDNEPATIANVIKEILSLSNDELLEMEEEDEFDEDEELMISDEEDIDMELEPEEIETDSEEE